MLVTDGGVHAARFPERHARGGGYHTPMTNAGGVGCVTGDAARLVSGKPLGAGMVEAWILGESAKGGEKDKQEEEASGDYHGRPKRCRCSEARASQSVTSVRLLKSRKRFSQIVELLGGEMAEALG